MSRGINKVIIVGSMGADPETRYTASGSAITSIRLATNESWTDKQTGQKQERTEWHRVKMFGRLAEIAAEYLRKGKQVYIEGSLRTDKYTDKDGIERYSTDIIANEMQMLGGAGGEGQEQQRGRRQASAPQPQATASEPPEDDIPWWRSITFPCQTARRQRRGVSPQTGRLKIRSAALASGSNAGTTTCSAPRKSKPGKSLAKLLHPLRSGAIVFPCPARCRI